MEHFGPHIWIPREKTVYIAGWERLETPKLVKISPNLSICQTDRQIDRKTDRQQKQRKTMKTMKHYVCVSFVFDRFKMF